MSLESAARATRVGQRTFLRDYHAGELSEALSKFFESMVEVPRAKIGNRAQLLFSVHMQ